MLLNALQSSNLEENPENVALVVGVLEAIGAHAERLLWEATHVADPFVDELPGEGEALVRAVVEGQSVVAESAFKWAPGHYEDALEAVGYPGDVADQSRTLWLDAIRKAARVLAGDREAVEAQSYMRLRLNDAPFEVDVDDEVKSLFEDVGGQ